MSDFYSKTGDDGTSGLLGNFRLPKNHPILEAVGAIDEANAALGIVRAQMENADLKLVLLTIQRDLYHIMSEVSATPENASQFRKMDHDRVAWLEEQIEIIGNQIHMPKNFIVPGDTIDGALLDFTRTVVRRAERRTSTLIHSSDLENTQILSYLNRLSTLCFILEIWVLNNNDSPISLSKIIET